MWGHICPKNGEFRKVIGMNEFVTIIKQQGDLNDLVNNINSYLDDFYEIEHLLDFFNEFSKALIRNREVASFEGVPFLANWLRKSNLKKLLLKNINDINLLNNFVGEDKKKLAIVPRGIVCHWVAGNVPTLMLFSVIQSLLVGNLNIARVSKSSVDFVDKLLKVLSGVKTKNIDGTNILNKMRIIYYPSDRSDLHQNLSLMADARVIWGGRESVDNIRSLSCMSHCEDIIFGPKYSFGVIDKSGLQIENIEKYIKRFIQDIVFVEQSGCSSPHVIFVEGPIEPIIDIFSKEFKEYSNKNPKNHINEAIATKIILKRAEYAMEGKILECSSGLDWTLLAGDDKVELIDPIQGNTLFIKSIDDIMKLQSVITREVQTIGLLSTDIKRSKKFSILMSLYGAARIVPPGQMNIYDSPWDGLLLMNRLVRWITLSII